MELQFRYKTNKNYWTYYSQFCKSSFIKPAKVCVSKVKAKEEFNFCFYLKCNMSIYNGQAPKSSRK